jgi:hypothetical protein
MDNQIAESVIAFCFPALIAFILYLFFRRYQVSTQLQSQRIESFNRLIEKFGSAKEFIEFAQSPQGKKILDEPIGPKPNPLNKVVRFIQAGVLFVMVGAGMVFTGLRIGGNTDPNYVHHSMESLDMGSLSLSLGVGLLIVAGITYIFVRRWHLANGVTKQ